MLSIEKDKKKILKTREVLKHMSQGMKASEAMMETEYQTTIRENPGGISETAAWRLVMEKYMPDEYLGQKHRALLEKTDRDGQPDTQAVGKGLELAYKIKGKLIDKLDVTTNGKALPAQIVFNFPNQDTIIAPKQDVVE